MRVAFAVAAASALLTAVLSYPLLLALLVTTMMGSSGNAALEAIALALALAVMGVPGMLAALLVRGLHPNGDRLRPWVVFLAAAAGMTIAAGFINDWNLRGEAGDVGPLFAVIIGLFTSFGEVFYSHHFEQLLSLATGSAAGAFLGAALSGAWSSREAPRSK